MPCLEGLLVKKKPNGLAALMEKPQDAKSFKPNLQIEKLCAMEV